jgi:hypothetical protein
VGRHLAIPTPATVMPARAARPAALTLHSHRSIPAFAFAVTLALLLLAAVDPYSGAFAAPKYELASAAWASEAEQKLGASTGELSADSRDGYSASGRSESAAAWQPPTVGIPDPGTAQAYALSAVLARGWTESEYACLYALFAKESGWRVNAYNASSGAYGIPQALPGSKMASAGADWQTSAETQVNWGLAYIQGRYGTPCGAWQHSQSRGWY